MIMKHMPISSMPAAQMIAAPRADRAAEGGRAEPAPAAKSGKVVPAIEKPELPEMDLTAVVESINNYLQSANRDLRFAVDEVTGRTVITVLDGVSQEVVRQIPPETARALAAYLRSEGWLPGVGVAERA
jgi:flagellar protein FlaG